MNEYGDQQVDRGLPGDIIGQRPIRVAIDHGQHVRDRAAGGRVVDSRSMCRESCPPNGAIRVNCLKGILARQSVEEQS